MLLLEVSSVGTGSLGVHLREACRQNIQRNQVGAHASVYALVTVLKRQGGRGGVVVTVRWNMAPM
jgi:hypothetical protein